MTGVIAVDDGWVTYETGVRVRKSYGELFVSRMAVQRLKYVTHGEAEPVWEEDIVHIPEKLPEEDDHLEEKSP